MDVAELAASGRTEPPSLQLRRSVGINGTRLSALRDEEVVGFVEVDTNLEEAVRMPRLAGWADVGNLWVADHHRRCGVATWLLAQSADWLRLAHVDRLLDYTDPEEQECRAFLEAVGFRLLTRIERGWERPPGSP